jgi:hypothetical protein
MSREVTAALVVMSAVLLPLMALTAAGQLRRRRSAAVAVTAGVFFPITWAVWYLRDERPWRSTAT